MNKTLKTILIVLSAILFVCCLAIDSTYIYLKYFSGEEKVVSSTFNLDLQTLKDGETRKPFIEVKYNSNAKGNGIELFDVKYNYLMDETKTNFFSQGIQYVGTDNYSITSAFNRFVKDEDYDERYDSSYSEWWNGKYVYYHKWWGSYLPKDMYNYQSYDDYETTTMSTNPIGADSFFKIDIDGTTYGMSFKNYKIVSNDNYLGREHLESNYYLLYFKHHYADYYSYYDYSYFNKILFNSIKSLSPGTDQYIVFEFGDLFDYYVFDEDTNAYTLVVEKNFIDEAKQIDANAQVDTTGLINKVKKEVKSYFAIKVSISEDGAQRASDSLFNCINGSQNFILPGLEDSPSVDDFYIGRSVIELTIDDFEEIVVVDENGNECLYLGLVKTTYDKWYPYRDKILFNIEFDVSTLENSVLGISLDSLNGFTFKDNTRGWFV